MSDDRLDWYRTPIDRDTLGELTRRSDGRGLSQCLLQLGMAVATAAGAWYSWHHFHWSVFLVVLFVHGTMMQFLGVTAACHELLHGTPFKNRRLSEFFYKLFSFISWSNPVWFRASHMEHHKFTTHSVLDQEVELPLFCKFRDVLKSILFAPAFWWQPPMRHLQHSMGTLTSQWDERLFPEADLDKRLSMFRWARIIVYGHVVLAAICIWFGEWILIPIALFPSYGGTLANLYAGAQHIGLQSNVTDFRCCCRTMVLSRFEAFLYWQMNYHIEHHMYPAVPFYNVPKLHKLVQADGGPEPNHGVWDAWREIRMIQRHQEETPEDAFDPFSRGKKEPVYVSQDGHSVI
jgi:fatty acid desaturase